MVDIAYIKSGQYIDAVEMEDLAMKVLYRPLKSDDPDMINLKEWFWNCIADSVKFEQIESGLNFMAQACEVIGTACRPGCDVEEDLNFDVVASYRHNNRCLDLLVCSLSNNKALNITDDIDNEINQIGCYAHLQHEVVRGSCAIIVTIIDFDSRDNHTLTSTTHSDIINVCMQRYMKSAVLINSNGTCETYYYQNSQDLASIIFDGNDTWTTRSFVNHGHSLTAYYPHSSDSSINISATRIMMTQRKIRGAVLIIRNNESLGQEIEGQEETTGFNISITADEVLLLIECSNCGSKYPDFLLKHLRVLTDK